MAKIEDGELFAPHLPSTAYVRLTAIVGKSGVLPISKATFYQGIKSGRFRAPTKLTPKVSAWTVGYVRELLAGFSAEGDVE